MEVGEHLDQRLGDRAALGGGEVPLGVGGLDQHVAVDEAHDVERRAVDRLVGAEPERRRDRHARGAERRDDLELAAHVVRGGEHRPERRTAQHVALAARVGDFERDVGVPGGDELEAERRARSGDVAFDPLGHARGVDAGECALGLVRGRHGSARTGNRGRSYPGSIACAAAIIPAPARACRITCPAPGNSFSV